MAVTSSLETPLAPATATPVPAPEVPDATPDKEAEKPEPSSGTYGRGPDIPVKQFLVDQIDQINLAENYAPDVLDPIRPAEVAEAVAKKARDISELAELAKRAEAEFSGLPGTADEKAVILKALCTKLSPEERMGVESLLKAGNACLAAGMRDVGKASPQGTGGDSWAQIETLAKARAAKDGIPQAEAVCKVLDENPELYTAYVSTSK